MKYIVALDQGTTSSRAVVVDENGKVVAVHGMEFPQIYPQPGWVEHDPMEIWDSERRAMKSNTNTVYGMLLELVYLAAMIGLVFLINDLTMFIVAAMGISLVLSVVIYVVMIKAAPRLQARMMEL